MTTTPSPEITATAHPLHGRVAVVTGASSGIGEATARALAAGGARVALLARRTDRLDALAGELGEHAVALRADVGSADDLAEAADEITARLGRPDLVVANAGVMLPAPIERQEPSDWDRMLDVNVTGVLRTVRAFLPSLQEAAAAGGSADIVTVSSVAARQRFAGYAVYCATKAAVTALAEGLRLELAPAGIRVTNVEPGLVATELQGKVEDPEQHAALQAWVAGTPPISAAELADVLAFLVSRPAHVNVPQLAAMPTGQV